MTKEIETDISFNSDDSRLEMGGRFTVHQVSKSLNDIDKALEDFTGESLIINLDRLEAIDSAGVSAVYYLRDKLLSRGINVELQVSDKGIRSKLDLFESDEKKGSVKIKKPGFIEGLGASMSFVFSEYISGFSQLAADITYWSATGLFSRKTRRKGEFVNQAVLIGVNAALIVGVMSFIIGFVLALQSAAQLRTFGANIYIVDLTVIAMMSEMGPLITAIMVAGRSGSSIAAEIATMKVTSEIDALQTMGLQPVRFVIVPKMYGALVTMPFLTIIADVLGIAGGMLIAVTSLGISPLVFLNRMEEVFMMKDVLFGIIKSLVFAYLIVITGSFFGLRVQRGAEGVGRMTTVAVVVAISLVIIADSIMGLIFY
ncbi:MAG: MlaE family lipid ABC transporter permease subunit [Bacteroidales bacterium]|nr:MlaE family lipid ABC transporter permease subunit [Bacteroidales bacterium]